MWGDGTASWFRRSPPGWKVLGSESPSIAVGLPAPANPTSSHSPGLQDMQRTLNRHKGAVISINLGSRHFQRGDSPEVRRLQEDLQEANQRWAGACAGLQAWETGLQGALMECQVRTPPATRGWLVVFLLFSHVCLLFYKFTTGVFNKVKRNTLIQGTSGVRTLHVWGRVVTHLESGRCTSRVKSLNLWSQDITHLGSRFTSGVRAFRHVWSQIWNRVITHLESGRYTSGSGHYTGRDSQMFSYLLLPS